MRILFLTDQTYLHGGIEKVLALKANFLAQSTDHEIGILTHSQKGKTPVYAFSKKIKQSDLGINYEQGQSYFSWSSIKKMRAHKRALDAALSELKPDVIVSCSFGPDYYFLPAIQKHIPKIKEFHSSRFFTAKPIGIKAKLMKRLSDKAEQKYDVLALLNTDEIPFYKNKQIRIIPNPAEPSVGRAALQAPKVLAAGRISPVKNFGHLIDIWHNLAESFPDWELHFYGEDYLGTQAKLQEKIASYHLEDSIKFMGLTSDLRTTMLGYSIYAMTSETECFPMVLLESLSVGLPIVSYDAPTGPKHIATDLSDAFVVPYNDSKVFEEKMSDLMRSPSLRQEMGQHALQNVERFAIENVMQQWIALFKELVEWQKG